MMAAPGQAQPDPAGAALLADYTAAAAECEATAKEAISGFADYEHPPTALTRRAIELHSRFVHLATEVLHLAGTDFRRHASIHRRIADVTDLIATLHEQSIECREWMRLQIEQAGGSVG